jgi:hypothetical protein
VEEANSQTPMPTWDLPATGELTGTVGPLAVWAAAFIILPSRAYRLGLLTDNKASRCSNEQAQVGFEGCQNLHRVECRSSNCAKAGDPLFLFRDNPLCVPCASARRSLSATMLSRGVATCIGAEKLERFTLEVRAAAQGSES